MRVAKEEPKDRYLRMRIDLGGRYLLMVWCGKSYGWQRIDKAEENGFRGVLKLTSSEAWDLKDEALKGGWFGGESYQRCSDIEIEAVRLSDRRIYVMYDWDAEEGDNGLLFKIRCDGFWDAQKYFETHHADQFKTRHQIRHISSAQEDWEAIAQMDLEADLIAHPVQIN